ncbi:hypothetical protein ABRQ82_004224 [Escherichia coli]
MFTIRKMILEMRTPEDNGLNDKKRAQSALKKMKILTLFYEALRNLRENNSVFITFIVFLSISLSGIIITDSLIYSSASAAQKELNIDGDNVVTIKFLTPQKKNSVDKIFKYDGILTKNAYKKLYMRVGKTSLNDELKVIIATEQISSNKVMFTSEKNEIVIKKNILPDDLETIYLEGLPFEIIGYVDEKKTDFLDSLGVTPFKFDSDYLISLATAIKLTLNDNIDALDIYFDHKIDLDDISRIKEELSVHSIKDYTIYSYIDAEKTVKKVIDRFSLLTDTIYILLTFSSLIMTIVICKKNFSFRKTEFAVKVIHGVPSFHLSLMVTIETVFITAISFFLSIIISATSLYFLSGIVDISIIMRFHVLILSAIVILIITCLSNIFLSKSFFSKNPLNIIKERIK